jgi:hypothetical protein
MSSVRSVFQLPAEFGSMGSRRAAGGGALAPHVGSRSRPARHTGLPLRSRPGAGQRFAPHSAAPPPTARTAAIEAKYVGDHLSASPSTPLIV